MKESDAMDFGRLYIGSKVSLFYNNRKSFTLRLSTASECISILYTHCNPGFLEKE